ncbi:MAG: YitT family protein [Clostridiales bacterium]|nr:YitT family protein [Clostridiales bacterium]
MFKKTEAHALEGNALTITNRHLFTPGKLTVIVLGTAISSFGVYNIHQQTNITEGGIMGLVLLLNHWTGLPVSILSPLLDISAYIFAFRFLGKDFLKVSLVASISLAAFFRLWEQFPPVLPDLSGYPVAAAIAGGLFIGIGTGLIIRQGGSGAGDDALAMAVSKIAHCRIYQAYMVSDMIVLLLSLSYIPLGRIGFSIITVTVSSFLIDLIQKGGKKMNYGVEAETAGTILSE